MFRQSEATRSRTAAATNIMTRGQGNQARSVIQSMGNTGGQELPIVRLVATLTLKDVGDLVLALGVANQVI